MNTQTLPARRLFVLLLCIATVIGWVGASRTNASVYAGQYRYLSSGDVEIRGADGALWKFAITATVQATGIVGTEQRVYLKVTRCAIRTCEAISSGSALITDRQVAIADNLTTASLRAIAAIPRIAITMSSKLSTGDVTSVSFDGAGFSSKPLGVAPSASQYRQAQGEMRIGELTCALGQGAEIGKSTQVDTVGNDNRTLATPRALPPSLFRGPYSMRCL